MYKKASSELVVARRRRGSDDRAEDVCVAAADRVQGSLGEDDGDDAVERDDRRVPRARERVVVEAWWGGEDSPITLQATRLRSSRLFRIEPRFTAVVMKRSQGGRDRQRPRNSVTKTARHCVVGVSSTWRVKLKGLIPSSRGLF